MVHRIECFRIIDGHGSGTGCGFVLVEPNGYGGGERKQGGGSGVSGLETMLRVVYRK